MQYTIRPAGPKDFNPIYLFICQLEETHFDLRTFEFIYEQNTADKRHHYLVAESANAEKMGFVSCHTQFLLHHCGKVAEIQELFIADHCRSLGIGLQLLKAVEKELINDQCVSFEVTAQNKRAGTHLFYEKSGFTCTHKKFVKVLP